MSRSRDAHRLKLRLETETGVLVQVRWDSSADSRGWRWHVSWADGPTEASMRTYLEHLAPQYPTLDPSALVYSRVVQPNTLALAMIRTVAADWQPALADPDYLRLLSEELDNADYPERGNPDELALAGVLERLSTDREAEMPEVLARYGLAGLRAELNPPDNVLPLAKGPRR